MAYRRDLEFWADYQKSCSPAPPQVEGFFAYLNKRGLSERSQARVISSLRTYLKFCQTQGDQAPLLDELRPPKIEAKAPQPLAQSDFYKILEAAHVPSEARTQRNQLTLTLLYTTGVRVSELISLDLNDVDFQDHKLRIRGKNEKFREVPLTDEVVDQIEKYLTQARPFLIKGELQCLLVNDRGRRPSRIDLWRWLAAWSEKAKFDQTVSPHQFRHGCAANMLQAGKNFQEVKELLGHASLQTTQMYSGLVN